MQISLTPYDEIKAQKWDSLLLGNGASIAISQSFSYKSLFNHAKEKGLIPESVGKVFHYFKTSDFEYVLRLLWHTYLVNTALGKAEEETKDAYFKLREGLIKTVGDIHCDYATVGEALSKIGEFAKDFKTVFCLNYDVTLYWALLKYNSSNGTWFKDCFINGEFDRKWPRLRKPIGTLGTTLVFFPHGNLVLGADRNGVELKLVSGSHGSLIGKIFESWNSSDVNPIFVSDGEHKHKLQSIMRSPYLSTVYSDVLPSINESLMIYGWSMSENDDHILAAIQKSNIRRLAISIRTGDGDLEEKCGKILIKCRQFFPEYVTISFFDSSSPGCWVN